MIIAVNNNKGGSLKTTTTTNLAGVLASQGKKVLIVDTDNQSNVALTFGKNPDEFATGLYDVLVDGLPAEHPIVNVYENIDLLPATDDLLQFDFDVINSDKHKNPFALMKDSLQPIVDSYDYILIDTPPSLSLMVWNVFGFADKVLIPYAPETYSVRSLVKVIGAINKVKNAINPELEILGVVPTLVRSATNLHTNIMDETRQYLFENKIHMFKTYIPSTIQFASAVAYQSLPATLTKQVLSRIKSKKQVATDNKAGLYYELWKEIEEVCQDKIK